MKKLAFVLIVLIISIGCVPRLAINYAKLDESLALKINYGEYIDEKSKALIDSTTNEFIASFNAQKHLFKIHRDDEPTDNYLGIDINDISYVESGTQALSTFVTLLGTATFIYTVTDPELGFYIWWYWLPHYTVTSKLYLSDDINLDSEPITRVIGGFHGYKSVDRQRESMKDEYKEFLFKMMEELEDI